jgi:hypothetical protein
MGTQGGTPCCTKHLRVGGEDNTNSAYVNGEAYGLQKKITGGWSYDWGGTPVSIGPGSTWSAFWLATGKDLFYSVCCVR